MSVRRRHLLSLLAAVVAGCGEASERDATGSDAVTARSTRSAATPTGPTVPAQSISIGNTRADPAFVTVAVEFEGSPVFVESRELVPGERHTMPTSIDRAGEYDVVVETASGDRREGEWRVEAGLDGLAGTLVGGADRDTDADHDIDLVRTVRCRDDCGAVVDGDTLAEPLVGDGSPRWYAPAQVLLRNPGSATAVTLSVELDDETLVDARYRVAREAQVVVPLTYRSGTYEVAVDIGGDRVAGEWRVPEAPTRVVDLTTLAVGCGPANTTLTVQNRDDTTHTLDVSVERDGSVRFAEQYRLDAGASRDVVPVSDSGRYDVRWRVDGGVERSEPWWSCPPHGPGTLLVDGTGTAEFAQEGGGL